MIEKILRIIKKVAIKEKGCWLHVILIGIEGKKIFRTGILFGMN